MQIIPYGFHSIDDSDIEAVLCTLHSKNITQGSKINEFEKALCKYTGAKYAIAVSSGTAALHIACLAAGLQPGDEAITSPITFVASANSIAFCGGIPVFADVEKEFITINPLEIEKKITKKTKIIIPVHFAGNPCLMEDIYGLSRKHKIIVIEDAAHALGAIYKGEPIGSCRYSDMAVFSFHPVKAITTGEGGAITTNSKEIFEKLLLYRNHGITKESSKFSEQNIGKNLPWLYEMQVLGYNYRLNDIQAALGCSQIKKLDFFIARRKHIASCYREVFKNNKNIKIFPILGNNRISAFHIYVIRIAYEQLGTTRKLIMHKLLSKCIGTQVHYIPVHYQPYYKNTYGYTMNNYPIAEKYYEEALTIPLYPSMKDCEINYIIKTINDTIL